MIKKIFGFILLACIILVMILSVKEAVLNNPEGILKRLPKQEGNIFTKGKELVFLVKYMGIIPVGKAKIIVGGLTNYNGRDVYRLVVEAETQGFVSIFYKARARIESYMDKNKLHSLRYTENIILPDKGTETKEIIYDQDNLIMIRKDFKRKILPNTQDPLSAIFYLRTQDFNIGESFIINTITKEEIYELKANVFKKEGDIWMLKITVARKNKSSYHGGNFSVWITDDAMRLPLLIKGWTQVGLITMRLVNIK